MNKFRTLFLLLSINFCLSVKSQVYKPEHPQSPQSQPSKEAEVKFPESSAYVNSKVTYKIINAASNTYCYDIFSDGKLIIHQPSVPGMPGNKGFKDKASAEKVAGLVINKIKKGEMPPTVTADEMKKLNANY